MATSDYQKVFDTLHEGVIMFDTDRRVTYWNLAAKRLTGFSSEETIGSLCHDNILNHIDDHGRMLCLDGCPSHQTMTDGKVRERVIYLQHKRGYRIPVRLRTIPIVEDGIVVGTIEIFIEVTEFKHPFNKMSACGNQVLVDALTHLPNRIMTEHFIKTKMNDYKMLGIPFGLAIVDLDNFEAINQTYGMGIGDDVLKLLSESFVHCFKTVDIIGRWDNDAFIFGFSCLAKDNFIKICDKIRIISESSMLRNTPFRDVDISVSIGGSLIRREDDAQILLDRVHGYLKKAKMKGGNNCVVK